MLEWIGLIPLLGLTGNWRGYRMGGKAIGGANMSTDMKKKFEAARAAGNMDQAKAMADKAQESKDKRKEKAAKTGAGFDPSLSVADIARQKNIQEPISAFGGIAFSEGRSSNSRSMNERKRQRDIEYGAYKKQLTEIENKYKKDAVDAFEKRNFKLIDAYSGYRQATGKDASSTNAWSVVTDMLENKGVSVPSPFKLAKLENQGGMKAVRSALDAIESEYFGSRK